MKWTRRRVILAAVAAIVLSGAAFCAFTFVRGVLQMRASKHSVSVGDMALKLRDHRQETGDYPHTPAEAFEVLTTRMHGPEQLALRKDGTIRIETQGQTIDVTYVYLGRDLPPHLRWKWRHWGLW